MVIQANMLLTCFCKNVYRQLFEQKYILPRRSEISPVQSRERRQKRYETHSILAKTIKNDISHVTCFCNVISMLCLAICLKTLSFINYLNQTWVLFIVRHCKVHNKHYNMCCSRNNSMTTTAGISNACMRRPCEVSTSCPTFVILKNGISRRQISYLFDSNPNWTPGLVVF